MAAWRGKRGLTWMTGVVAFVSSIGTAFTGYLSQSNFDSQWISAEAKDGINSIGAGAHFNVLNPGQMLMWHMVLLPLVVGLLAVWHVILVRRHGGRAAAGRRPPGARRGTYGGLRGPPSPRPGGPPTRRRTPTTSRPATTTSSRSSSSRSR